MILFNKLTQTIVALKRHPKEPSHREKIETYKSDLNQSVSDKVPNRIVRFGVIIAFVIPSSILLSSILHKLTSWSGQNLGSLAMIVGIAVGIAISKLNITFINRIPFHKLNPYFGSKLEETFAALSRKHS